MDMYHHHYDAFMPCQKDSNGKAEWTECKCLYRQKMIYFLFYVNYFW